MKTRDLSSPLMLGDSTATTTTTMQSKPSVVQSQRNANVAMEKKNKKMEMIYEIELQEKNGCARKQT